MASQTAGTFPLLLRKVIRTSWEVVVRYRSFISIVPAMLMAAVLAKPSTALGDEWHRTYNVSGRSTVHIETNDGAVRVSTWEGKQIEARVETTGWRIDDGEVRIIERQVGDRLELEARVPNFHWNSGFRNRSLRIELRIPVKAI